MGQALAMEERVSEESAGRQRYERQRQRQKKVRFLALLGMTIAGDEATAGKDGRRDASPPNSWRVLRKTWRILLTNILRYVGQQGEQQIPRQ